MSTLNQLNEDGLLSNEDKVLLNELVNGDENILVIGNDKQMNGILLMAILRERLSYSEHGWYFRDRSELNIEILAPYLMVLNSKHVESYLDAREFVRNMPHTPIVIDEINTQAMAEFFLECCVGLRSRVTATYTGYGDSKDLLESFAQLTRPTEGVDHRTFDYLVNYVRGRIKVFVIYFEENGQKKISVVDNRTK